MVPSRHKLPYTSRLQKGGALLESMRALSLAWEDGQDDNLQLALNVSGLPSRYRASEVIRRMFIPRLVESDPPNLYRVAAVLERSGCVRSIQALVLAP